MALPGTFGRKAPQDHRDPKLSKQAILERVHELDQRRQEQIDRQTEIIGRLTKKHLAIREIVLEQGKPEDSRLIRILNILDRPKEGGAGVGSDN